MNVFKQYLEKDGAELCKSNTQFLTFYALPYIPDPRNHPSFKQLFEKSWYELLEGKLSRFVVKHVRQPKATSRLEDVIKAVNNVNITDTGASQRASNEPLQINTAISKNNNDSNSASIAEVWFHIYYALYL
jgi:hypothetical protein